MRKTCKSLALSAALLVVAGLASCSRGPRPDLGVEHSDLDVRQHPRLAALHFAPRLHLNRTEPSRLLAVMAVLHPGKPLIAYHIFFDDDILLSGRGKQADHEIVWVEYDPVTWKIAGVAALWHRTILRTQSCLLDAKAGDQRPQIEVQWGQHGMLPLGWQSIKQARPRLELMAHYEIARYLNRLPKASPNEPAVTFDGSYADYLTFEKALDTTDYIEESGVCVTEDPHGFLTERIASSFTQKKNWPDDPPSSLPRESW